MEKLNIISGNILDYLDGMDAIVNSANKYMTYGSGVCGVIYKKANKEKLEEYCINNFKDDMEVNEIRITPGFDLKIDIIHIYCPKAYESKEPIKELLDSYENIFRVAKGNGYKRIISVSLGTGIHAYKHNEIGKYIFNKLNELVDKYDIEFNLILQDEKTIKEYTN